MNVLDIGMISVVPSPYQRDLFQALADRKELSLAVYYLERSSPDSPWPEQELRPYEQVLSGFWTSVRGARVHVVTKHPSLARHQVVVLNSLTSSLAQLCLRRKPIGQKLIFWAEALRQQQGKWRQLTQNFLTEPIKNADAIAAIGSRAMALYQKQFPATPRFNIPYHCELAPFRDRPATFNLRDGEVVFLFCGQVIARKGVDVLIRAFDNLIREGLPARLLLAGRRADLDEMLSLASAEARARIYYEGFVNPVDLPALFAKSHAFVLPSRYDGWGVVVNQALGAGLPIICSDAVGAGHELVHDGINGYRVPTGDVVRLAAAMKSLVIHPHRLADYGQASLAIANDWTPRRGAEKWLTALDQLDSAHAYSPCLK